MVIIMCMAGACQSIYQEAPFSSYEECKVESQKTAQIFNRQYPSSQGEIYCFDKEQFNIYLNTAEELDKEKISL